MRREGLFDPLPVLYVTAVTTAEKKKITGNYCACPCYANPNRTDQFYIFDVDMKMSSDQTAHWVTRGVALLANKEV